MLSLNNLRTKFGVVLVVVIGAVLLAFVLGDLVRNPQQGAQNPIVGEIDGDEVEYSKFYLAYQDIVALNGNNNANYDMSSQLIQMTWQSILFDDVMLPSLEKLGLVVTPAEREAVLQGKVSSDVLSNVFGVDGKYDPTMLSSFLEVAAADAQRQNIWNLLEKQIYTDRVSGKFMDLVRNGAYANTLMLNKGVIAQNNTYKGHFVACNYSTVADSLVSVSSSEIKKYYEANKAKYKQTPYRTVRYAHFENEPSALDKKAIEEAAKSTATLFGATKDLKAYVVGKNFASLASNYVSEDSFSTEEAAALRGGKMFGPELRGDEWYASRVAEVITAPKTLELQQIAIAKSEANLVDSLYNAAKAPKADFAALAPQGSYADMGEVNFSIFPVELAKKMATVSANDVVKADLGGTTIIFKVSKVGQRGRHYLLATQTHPVVASKETKETIYKEAGEFLRKAKASAKGFDEAAVSVPTSSMNVNRGSRNVPGLANSIEVVRWANGAKVGEVSDIIKLGEGYVVAVVTAIDEAEYKSLDKVSNEIKNVLLAQKKAALLKEKMQGATLEEIAANAGATVKEFSGVKTSSAYVSGINALEPRVVGVLEATTAEGTGKVLPLIEGRSGVYAIVVDEVAVETAQTVEAERVKAQAETESMAASRAMWAVQEKAEIKDHTANYL